MHTVAIFGTEIAGSDLFIFRRLDFLALFQLPKFSREKNEKRFELPSGDGRSKTGDGCTDGNRSNIRCNKA